MRASVKRSASCDRDRYLSPRYINVTGARAPGPMQDLAALLFDFLRPVALHERYYPTARKACGTRHAPEIPWSATP
jgi:hypothetical protein